jgi:hypothetical protein
MKNLLCIPFPVTRMLDEVLTMEQAKIPRISLEVVFMLQQSVEISFEIIGVEILQILCKHPSA